jgi:hypothetical protein
LPELRVALLSKLFIGNNLSIRAQADEAENAGCQEPALSLSKGLVRRGGRSAKPELVAIRLLSGRGVVHDPAGRAETASAPASKKFALRIGYT